MSTSVTESSRNTDQQAGKRSLRSFLQITALIFISEVTVMVVLHNLSVGAAWEIILDPILLALLSAPLLHRFVVRPMREAYTERFRAEQVAQGQARALARTNEALEEANHAAEAATRAKSGFLANMSHELRTPMTAILGFSDELLSSELSQSERLEAIETIHRNGKYLLQLINDVLDLSKVEAGKLTLESVPCSPAEMLGELRALMESRATSKGLTFNVILDESLPELIQTDPMRLRQVLINLIGNAIKFTREGEVRITARSLQGPRLPQSDEQPMLQIEVTDTGIGIDADHLQRVFDPFTQADPTITREFGGTGLGLAISKCLIEQMGGTIELESEPGHGTTFRVLMPIGKPAQAESVPLAAADTSRDTHATYGPKRQLVGRILLAEDGIDNQRLVSLLLRKAGAEVTLAENGRIACDRAFEAEASGSPFDLILMDIQMPVLDGYAATRELRDRGHTGPIVALTAHAMAEDRQKCLNAGCDDYLSKPVDREQLLSMAATYLSQAADV